MEISLELLKVIFSLLPGFITAEIIYLLTSYLKPSAFERIVQALILTALVKGGVVLAEVFSEKCGCEATEKLEYVFSICIAIVLGLVISWCINNDFPNRILRLSDKKSRLYRYSIGLISKLNLTNKTLHPNEWYSFFYDTTGFVILYLTGERRLMCQILQYPDKPNDGFFIVFNAGWIRDDQSIESLDRVDLGGRRTIEIIRVEAIKREEEK